MPALTRLERIGVSSRDKNNEIILTCCGGIRQRHAVGKKDLLKMEQTFEQLFLMLLSTKKEFIVSALNGSEPGGNLFCLVAQNE